MSKRGGISHCHQMEGLEKCKEFVEKKMGCKLTDEDYLAILESQKANLAQMGKHNESECSYDICSLYPATMITEYDRFVEEFGRQGMHKSQIELFFTQTTTEIKPEMKAKITRFFSAGLHIAFEEADNKGNLTFFERAYDSGWIDCLIWWRNATIYAFEWDNFDSWLHERDSEKFNTLEK